jgi:hypothetical protein
MKAQFFDLKVSLNGHADEARLTLLVEGISPDRHLKDLADTYNNLLAALKGLKSNIQLAGLTDLYDEVKARMLDMLPPYAKALLDPEAFKRLMRLADPSRFMTELDARFDALKNKLLPIRPEDISAELDETYDTVLGLVEGLDLEDSFNRIKDDLNRIKGVVNAIRVDFLAADIDAAVSNVRAMVDALDPADLLSGLDDAHQSLEAVVDETKPSALLSGLGETIDQVKDILDAVDPRVTLEPPLLAAWQAVLDLLGEVDFTIILSPLVEKLDELEDEFISSLERTERAFDNMLGAAKGALGGSGGGASAGVGGGL